MTTPEQKREPFDYKKLENDPEFLKMLCDELKDTNEHLAAENARLREVVEQCLHARQCNAPYGQTEKYPSVEQLKAALTNSGNEHEEK